MSERLPTYIYFIQVGSDGAIKIGFSQDPTQRLATLQHHHPTTLRLLAIVPGGSQEETALHQRFAAHRLRGEWFAPVPRLVDHIATLPPLDPPTREELQERHAAFHKAQREKPQDISWLFGAALARL